MSVTIKVDKTQKLEEEKHQSLKSRNFTRLIKLLRSYLDTDAAHPGDFGPTRDHVKIFLLTTTVAGSGTTLIAADKHNRKSIGFEISPDYEQAIKNKEEKCLRQLHFPEMT